MRPGELDPQTARYITHSRESSLEKLQSGGPIALSSAQTQSQSQSSSSASRIHLAGPRLAAGGLFEPNVDPKTAASYGHHRQTSIVHGIQHSRDGSVASASSSPLSPQIIAAAGAGLTPERAKMNPYGGDAVVGSRPPTSMSGSTLIPGPQIPERTSSATDASAQTLTQRMVAERMQSGKSRRDHAHSQSRHHRDEQKTVGEYALHVLFTSVCQPGRW